MRQPRRVPASVGLSEAISGLGGSLLADSNSAMQRINQQLEESRQRYEAQLQSERPRGDDREISIPLREEPGLPEWIRNNCLRVTVRDPSTETRHKAIINADHWRDDLRTQQVAIRPEVLIKILPEISYGWYIMKQEYRPEADDFISIRLNLGSEYGGSEYAIKLEAKARSIDITRLGHISLAKPKYISPQLFATYVRYGAAQAWIDNINNTEGGLCVRDFLLANDFLDGQGDILSGYEWQQPQTSAMGYPTSGGAMTLYTTGRACSNDRKIYFLYGIKNLKYSGIPRKKDEVGGVIASVGGPAEIFLSKIDIKRADVMTLDIADTSLINDMGALFFQRPILFKRGDDIHIQGHLKNNAMGKTDNLRPLGFVVESLGPVVHG
jgi:hypothetical protein